ncbi:STAS/SEC14 domain-containing protein [Sorangium sp. So ce590]|uniref:STAS/SEC14 domain-containing protein n=1 Tax=unclassified Sorangium TaxID=2621164 RepID=UPI003F6282F1
MNSDGSFWVELVGEIIVVRVRGRPTEDSIRGCQDAVLMLLRDTARSKILYDTLEMVDPTADLAIAQQALDVQIADRHIRRAIVVPNARLAYLSRIAFGDGEHRVFYNDLSSAFVWLQDTPTST